MLTEVDSGMVIGKAADRLVWLGEEWRKRVLTVSGDILDEDLHRVLRLCRRGAGRGGGEAVGTHHDGGVGEASVNVELLAEADGV